MRRSLILLSLLFFSVSGFSQVSSIASGDWTDPNIWDCGCVPLSINGTVTIEKPHTVTITSTVTIDDIIVNPEGVLVIDNGGRLVLGSNLTQEPADPSGLPPTFVDGTVNVNSGGVIENKGQIFSIPMAMIFSTGSEYQHNQTNGVIVGATWSAGSTCRINGWVLNSNANGPFRTSLNQSFHHFIWDNPGQIAGNVQFLGFLKTVNGNLIINNTNSRIISLGLNGSTTGAISVSGNLEVNNASKVSLSTAGTYDINVSGNVILSSTALDPLQYNLCSSSGITNFNITGDLILNSGQLNIINAGGNGNINIGHDLALNGGSIVKTAAASGTGTVSFAGNANHNLSKVSGTFTTGNLIVQAGSILNFSGVPLAMAGNIIVQNGATFNFPPILSTSGNLQFNSGSTINSNSGTLTLTGSTQQLIDANGAVLANVTLNKTLNSTVLNSVQLTSPLSITNELLIPTPNTVFASGGYLRLRSTSDSTIGNARIGQLIDGASISGTVITERFMSPEGRIYRYISSPVKNAPISQLQNAFPVTGPFTGSSTCTGCSTNASLFYYNAATAAYVNYPAAITDPLAPGRGYAAYVRQDVVSMPLDGITVDLTGPINYGSINLPVFHNLGVTESWNLVGNPYPSSIDWDDPNWTKTNMSTSIAVRDNAAGAGMFLYWNGAIGDIANGVIAQGQGFWVRTTNPSPVLTIQEQAKSTATGEFFRKSGSDFISMTITKGALYDKAYIQLQEGAKVGLDDYDAPKLVNDNFDFYTQFVESTPMAINAIENLSCQTEFLLDLRFTKNSSNAFVINPNGAYNLGFNIGGSEFDLYRITLKDQFTNSQQVVTSGFEYSFNVTTDPASFASGRLKLVVEAIQPKLDLNLESSDVVCKKGEANVIVKNSEKMFEYYLIGANDAISSTQSGTDGDLIFVVPDSLLNGGVNQIKVGVKGVCGVILLNKAVEVERFEDAAISLKAGDILISNHKTGNQWYFNEDLIPGAIDQEFKVMESGLYKVVATTGGCSSSAETNYIITGIEGKGNGILEIYPNPFVGEIHLIPNSTIDLSTISVMNNLGQSVCERSSISQNEKGEINIKLNNLPDGLYFVRVTTANTVQTIKVIKDSRTR